MSEYKLSPRTHMLSIAGALAISGLTIWSPAATAAGGTYYRAELVSPASDARFVARDVVWACKGTVCIAGQGTSRPLVMCSALAKAAGPVASFVAKDKPLDADELARCNAVK